MWQATIGFLITGVGLPLMGVAAMGISRSNGLIELSGKVSRGYSVCLHLRAVSDHRALLRHPALRDGAVYRRRDAAAGHRCRIRGRRLPSSHGVFFLIVLRFSLFPGKILTWVGKILNPLFLLFLGVLVVAVLVNPDRANLPAHAPDGSYRSDQAFSTGFLEGYNTMDALASLAFGIIVIDVIRGAGDPRAQGCRKEYRQGRCVQLLADGTDLSGSDGRRRPEPRPL